ncbi:MAG: AbrB/MazE/SpoVT family DNA-binding domain-containing protein [Clostridia bacterium]|nr:AbrB/MazE/SpoVT family DNA-binding domain-containing protein [Clostridia bacterium]
MSLQGPDGKYIFGMAKVGAKGQIVIPKEARDLFGIQPGDSLLIAGDTEARGLAIMTGGEFMDFARKMLDEQKT